MVPFFYGVDTSDHLGLFLRLFASMVLTPGRGRTRLFA